MEVSIVIVNYNTQKLTLDCIKSIKDSDIKAKYEIIVIDNASDEKLPESKSYKLIANNYNLGFARANNQGIKEAKGKYILLLNSDTIVKKGAIDKLYQFATEHDDAGAIVPKLLNPDKTIQASAFKFPTIVRAIEQYFLGKKNLLDKYIPQTNTIEVGVMAAFLITPKALKSVGILDEKYFMYFEDFDYCRKIHEKGLKIYYVPEAEVIHIHGASGGKNKYLVESAKKYHGFVGYYIYTSVLWLGQKWQKMK